MMAFDYDIAIVGLGPAGANLARLLPASYRVVALDKCADNSVCKPCGGLLSEAAQQMLSKLNLHIPSSILVNPQILSVQVLDLATGQQRRYHKPYINLDRAKFDNWLISLIPDHVCIKHGARVSSIERLDNGFRVFYYESGATKSFTACYLVGADGANSIVRHTFFPKKRIRHYVAIQQWFVDTGKPYFSAVYDKKTSEGCSWSIHKDNYFIYGGAFVPKDCRKMFELQKERAAKRFSMPLSDPLKTEACIVLRPTSAFQTCPGDSSGLFLIGEAAGYISPSSFEGISFALDSSTVLAEAFTKNCRRFSYYRYHTAHLRRKITLRSFIRCPIMFNPFLRSLALSSGFTAIE